MLLGKRAQQFRIEANTNARSGLSYFQLVHNGFVFAENNSDCLTLKLGISKNDALAVAKYNLLVSNIYPAPISIIFALAKYY